MILALDFETANGDAGSICSVGIASLGGGGEIEREEILIRPHDSCSRFSCFNVMIHGIRPDMVRNAPEWSDIWPRIAGRFARKCRRGAQCRLRHRRFPARHGAV